MQYQAVLKKYKQMVIIAGFGIISIALSTPGYAQANTKIGVVDIRKIYDNWDEKKKIDEQFNPDRIKLEEQQKNLETAIANLDRRRTVLDANQIEQEEKKIAAMRTELQQSFISIREKIDAQAEILSTELNRLMRSAIQELVKTEGYTLVIDSRSVYHANNRYDLTDKIIQKINNPKKTTQ